MELTASELWARVLDTARKALPEQSFRTWLTATEAVGLSGEEVLVEAPSQFHVEWIEDKYGALLEEAVERAAGRAFAITYRAANNVSSSGVPTLELRPPSPASNEVVSRSEPAPARLNERYSFDRFVVGNNNQLAAAACHAVAEKPARMYNPLFVYGGVGLGKTHLMHAIGNYMRSLDAGTRIAYLPTEQFTNELVTSIQEGVTPEFRRRYRQMDLLLVDDIHFLEGKERTQEEFFHTFNALYDAQKQIVLTSDRPPKDIPGLEERLVSRFEWGLVADIKPPDYETRVAIVRKKAAYDRLSLDDDVTDFIARWCTSSVRELEGAMIKLLAFSSLTNQEISVGLARTALQGTRTTPQERRPETTPDRIRAAAAKAWGVDPGALVSKRRTKDLTVPRQVAMYLIRDLLDTPLVRIGGYFGGRDHSTVIHSIRKVEASMDADRAFHDRVHELREGIRRGGS